LLNTEVSQWKKFLTVRKEHYHGKNSNHPGEK
jgi:hypothetical protein